MVRPPWLALFGLVTCTVLAIDDAPSTRVAIRVEDNEALAALALDIWSEHRGPGLPLDMVVDAYLVEQLVAAGVEVQIIEPDIDAVARAERERLEKPARPADWFAEYRNFHEISAHLAKLAALNSDWVSMHEIGRSIEGHPIFALKIGLGTRRMMVNGTQHAREWIAAMVPACIADRLVNDYKKDARVRAFVDSTTLWVVPIVNPDGYQHSWSSDRYWRKNRRARHGVDLNRNFSVAWGGKGSSKNERAEDYRGAHAFSEPESVALRDLVLRERIGVHVDFHAFGQLLLHPWGYTRSPSEDHARFRATADRMASAMFAEHETRYTLMASSELYLAAGTMTDWMYGEAKAESFTIELRPKRGGRGGFVLPPDQIRPTCDEGLAAVLELGKRR